LYSPTLKGMILFLNYNWDEYHYTPLFIYKYDFFWQLTNMRTYL
jgi:hypothetical protein